VTLIRKRDGHRYSAAQIDTIVEALAQLERLGRGVTRYGTSLESFLDQHQGENYQLPRYLARVREGNTESFEYLMDDQARSEFVTRMGMDQDQSEQIEAPSTAGGASRRLSIHEIFEGSEISKLLVSIADIGMDVKTFSATEEPRYTLVENLDQKNESRTELFTILQILKEIRASGRRGLSIQRYKGLGEMNPKQLYETTMDPQKRRLLRVNVADAARADELFTILMGDEVPPRRAFIEDNALNVSYLDV
jgi:DNA gyrase subunit B